MKLKTLVYLSLIALVASLGPAAQAQTFGVIHSFSGTDGVNPYAGVTLKSGDLYGTTVVGGRYSWGTVYQAKRSENNKWSVSPLSYFPISGAGPQAGVVFGPDGSLYGTTSSGGNGDGNVVELTAPSTICKVAFCPWTENELHIFPGGADDGAQPGLGDLIFDQQGSIYGTTLWGGQSGLGTVYQMTKAGSTWTESVLYSFSGPEGSGPVGGVIFDNNGNLFGIATRGGPSDVGTVFELKYVVGVGWTEAVLYSFQNSGDGARPYGGLIFDNAGNLYGTTANGGSGQSGTVFELTPSGDTWSFHLLYSLTGYGGCGSLASLAMDGAGDLYGTTYCAGAYHLGNIFKLSRVGNSWVYTSVHDFTGSGDGAYPVSNVTIDTDGTLYGTTNEGGTYGAGTIWTIKP